jgi:hypothetical protein
MSSRVPNRSITTLHVPNYLNGAQLFGVMHEVLEIDIKLLPILLLLEIEDGRHLGLSIA